MSLFSLLSLSSSSVLIYIHIHILMYSWRDREIERKIGREERKSKEDEFDKVLQGYEIAPLQGDLR